MDILYTMNDGYIPQVAASMMSVLDHNNWAPINFHVFSLGISRENIQKLEKMLQERGASLTVYEIGNIRERIDFPVDTNGFHISVLARLFTGSILPEHVEKVLYLDGDTIVLDSLEELWEMDMGDSPIAMRANATTELERKKKLGISPEILYCNAGVIFFDLKKWRAERGEEKVFDYYQKHNGNLFANDQDALNGAFAGRIKFLPIKYNFSSSLLLYPYKMLCKWARPAVYYTEEIYHDAISHPAIVHFLGEERPWRAGNRHPYREEFRHYLAQTPWKDRPEDQGWKLYFLCFYTFNFMMKPFPSLRCRIINGLIPAFMRYRKKQLKKKGA